MDKEPFTCLTCGVEVEGWGNNPHPLNDHESLEDRRVCGDCNAMYVIPTRLGHAVAGDLYDTHGEIIGHFVTRPKEVA